VEKLSEQGRVRGVNLDSILSAHKNQRADARVIIDTVSAMEQGSGGRSGAENLSLLVEKHDAISKDTIYLYINEYELNKSETDSVWHAIFERRQTQSLLRAYLEQYSSDIFRRDNYINLISVFKAAEVSYKTKRQLLLDKFLFDDRTIKKVKSTDSRSPTDINRGQQPAYWRAPRPEQQQPYLITIPFQSKKQVVSDYLKIIERSSVGNFAEAKIAFVKARGKKKKYRLIRAKISEAPPISVKTIRKIKRMRIIDVQLYTSQVSRALYSDNNGLLVIQYLK